MPNELQVSQSKAPAELIAAAMAAGTDLDKLEKLLSLQERWEAGQAKKQYAEAFALVQAKVMSVVKTKLNPQTHSKYADLSDVIESVQPLYTDAGFSITFDEGDTDKPETARIIAHVLHRSGHKETYHYDVPLDGTGIKGNANMTKIHGKASSTTYGRRYLMCMIWNIPTADNDENTKPPETISEEELMKLQEWIVAANVKEADIFKYLNVTKFEEITKPLYAKAISALKAKAEPKKEQPKPEVKK